MTFMHALNEIMYVTKEKEQLNLQDFVNQSHNI